MTGYGADDFRKITNIGSINRTGPDAGGSGGMYQHRGRKQKDDEFAKILDVEKNTGKRNDISVKNTTYGPGGMAQKLVIQMKDYTFQ
ncbi:MAG: hypothetical protein IJL90_03520 [Lachnospiraceae bacterium]|nr:hypothetical protein [Lachnospiraceae bacterium]MBR4574209.1 hypothetical protein [Lachnospiraceae bacterium]